MAEKNVENGLARKCATYNTMKWGNVKNNNNNNKLTKEKQKKQKQKPKKSKYKIILPYYRLRKIIAFDYSSKSKVNASRSWGSDFGYWWSLLSRDECAIYTRRASLAGNTTSGTAENCYPLVARLPGDSRANHAFWPLTYFHRKKWLHAFCYHDVISLL